MGIAAVVQTHLGLADLSVIALKGKAVKICQIDVSVQNDGRVWREKWKYRQRQG